MRLVDITEVPDDQYLDFLRWFSMKNPETTWYAVFLDRLEKRKGTFEAGVVLRKLLVDSEGFEFLALYRNSITCPVTNGMFSVCVVATYSRESRYEAEKGLAPDVVMVMVQAGVNEHGKRWVKREDRFLMSLAFEPAPSLTEADIRWSKEEMAQREITRETTQIRSSLGLA